MTAKDREWGDECEDVIEEYRMSIEKMRAEKKKSVTLILKQGDG